MSSQSSNHQENHFIILKRLVEEPEHATEIEAKLLEFGWDHELDLVELNFDHIRNALSKWLDGSLSNEELVAWANAVEGREDLGRPDAENDLINDVLFEISSPEINGRMTSERAEEITNKPR